MLCIGNLDFFGLEQSFSFLCIALSRSQAVFVSAAFLFSLLQIVDELGVSLLECERLFFPLLPAACLDKSFRRFLLYLILQVNQLLFRLNLLSSLLFSAAPRSRTFGLSQVYKYV